MLFGLKTNGWFSITYNWMSPDGAFTYKPQVLADSTHHRGLVPASLCVCFSWVLSVQRIQTGLSRRRNTVRLSVECWGGGKDLNSGNKDSGQISFNPWEKRNCRSEWFPPYCSALRGVSYCQVSSFAGVCLLKSPHRLFFQPAISLPWVPAPHNSGHNPSWLPAFLKAPLHTTLKLQL